MMAYLKVLLLVLCAVVFYIKYAYAEPVSDCQNSRADPYGNYYVSDDTDRCVFYWCSFDEYVSLGDGPFMFSCPPGLGTRPQAQGIDVICTETLDECGAEDDDDETTAAGTVTTESSPVRSTVPGMHLPGGVLQRMYREPAHCLLSCVADDDCFGADFNNRFRTCWFHNATNVCREPQAKEQCTHYKFVDCVDTTQSVSTTTLLPTLSTTARQTTTTTPTTTTTIATTTTTTTTTTPEPTTADFDPVLDIFDGVNLGGGVKAENIRDLDQCIRVCYIDPACVGLDFDFRDLTCWLHTQESECGAPRQKPGCAHYRLEDVCSATTEAATTDDAMTTQEDSAQTTAIDQEAVPNGYHSMLSNMHLSGGELLLTQATLQQCLDACLMQAACLAVDYDSLARTCYGFGAGKYCGEPLPMSLTNHYKRAPCIDDIDTSMLKEVRLKFHKPGGARVCSGDGCSLTLCLRFCLLTTTCLGADYDERDMGCYMHTAASVCGPPLTKDYCSHYSLTECDGDDDSENEVGDTTTEAGGGGETTGFPAPTTGFIALNYPGPKVLPSGWQAYPGMQVSAGRRISLGLDGDECFTLCTDAPTCLAVDFNSYDGSCYFFETDALRCDTLNSANLVYHALKPPPCTGYPTPVATAP